MLPKRDPIIAQATALGKAGIGVVRISGEDLSPLLHKVSDTPFLPRQSKLLHLRDQHQQSIDQG